MSRRRKYPLSNWPGARFMQIWSRLAAADRNDARSVLLLLSAASVSPFPPPPTGCQSKQQYDSSSNPKRLHPRPEIRPSAERGVATPRCPLRQTIQLLSASAIRLLLCGCNPGRSISQRPEAAPLSPRRWRSGSQANDSAIK